MANTPWGNYSEEKEMKKTFAVGLVVLGIAFVGGGAHAVERGIDARDQVRAELARQNITTPADASIANAPVRDAATAKAMADIIDVHARETTGGLSYGEMGRFMTKDRSPAGTNIEAEAVRGADGQPLKNPLRSVAFEASANRTGLYTSVMAFNVSDLVVGIGLMTLAVGLAFAGVGIVIGGLRVPVPVRRTRLAQMPALST
jgi:hypothetical protein